MTDSVHFSVRMCDTLHYLIHGVDNLLKTRGLKAVVPSLQDAPVCHLMLALVTQDAGLPIDHEPDEPDEHADKPSSRNRHARGNTVTLCVPE